MELNEYQSKALATLRKPIEPDNDLVVSLLGLAGEAGELLSEYKKHLRDGAAHTLFSERVAEELGDLLWYIASVAHKFDLNLDEVAYKNLEKCNDRWGEFHVEHFRSFDEGYPESERFPRLFEVEFVTVQEETKIKARASINGVLMGDDLTDNAYQEDGYRFHDVFHLACVAVLGWSPVIRKLLGCKRKSIPKIDEVEDGGRATAIEEGICALVFSYAETHEFLKGVSTLDIDLLKLIRRMTSGLEVSACPPKDWHYVILNAFRAWNDIKSYGQGKIIVNLDARSIQFEPI